jgi:pyruvate dehydrogenase E1 component
MLHADQPPRQAYVEQQFAGLSGPFIAASEYVRAVAEQIDPWVPGGLFALGTDGLGRSDTRQTLRRHFEVDAECITLAALYQLAKRGQWGRPDVAAEARRLGIDPEKIDPLTA